MKSLEDRIYYVFRALVVELFEVDLSELNEDSIDLGRPSLVSRASLNGCLKAALCDVELSKDLTLYEA